MRAYMSCALCVCVHARCVYGRERGLCLICMQCILDVACLFCTYFQKKGGRGQGGRGQGRGGKLFNKCFGVGQNFMRRWEKNVLLFFTLFFPANLSHKSRKKQKKRKAHEKTRKSVFLDNFEDVELSISQCGSPQTHFLFIQSNKCDDSDGCLDSTDNAHTRRMQHALHNSQCRGQNDAYHLAVWFVSSERLMQPSLSRPFGVQI